MPQRIHTDMSIGERIALWREYRGMTQEACAGSVGRSLAWWKKIEGGIRRVDRFSDLLLIAQVLKVRDLVDLTGAWEFSLALDRARDHQVLPDIRAAMLGAVAPYVASDRPPRDGTLRDQLTRARWVHHHSGRSLVRAGALLPSLIVDATVEHRRAGTAEERRISAALLSEIYVLACQILRHASAFDLAFSAVDRALTYAYEADDPVLVGWAVWQSSGVLKDQGNPDEGLSAGREAVRLLEPLMEEATDERLSIFGELHLQIGLMAAHCADEGTAMRYFDLGDQAYRRIAPVYRSPMTTYGQDGPAWAAVWVPTALGRYSAARAAADRLDVSGIPSRPFRAWWWITVARGHAATRNDVATMSLLERAEQASAETVAHSVHVREMVREMMRRDRKTVGAELRDFARRTGIMPTVADPHGG